MPYRSAIVRVEGIARGSVLEKTERRVFVYNHVRAIEVSIWGRHVGTIVPKSGTYYRFQYVVFRPYLPSADVGTNSGNFVIL